MGQWSAKVLPWPLVASAAVMLLAFAPSPEGAVAAACPSGMVSVRGEFCIDQYEAATDELASATSSTVKGRHSPFEPVGSTPVRAVSIRGRTPQAHISRNEAELACHRAGKRLCTDNEWLTACKGKSPTTFPYGSDRKDGYCNDRGRSGMNLLFGGGAEAPKSAYTFENMNDSRLNQLAGTLAPAGAFSKCKNSFKTYDMVGNLHEWTASASGTFRGGYYLDTHQHGNGCDYVTTAHSPKYHDYSTGFRCCKGGDHPTPVMNPSTTTGGGGSAKPASDRTDSRERTPGKKTVTGKATGGSGDESPGTDRSSDRSPTVGKIEP